MRGSRPLTREEVQEVKRLLPTVGRCRERNYFMFVLGVNTGFRISELLSLRINDFLNRDGTITDYLTVKSENMKANGDGRTVYMNSQAKEASKNYIEWYQKQLFYPYNQQLFYSERFKLKRIDKVQAWKILDKVFRIANLQGQLGTHAMRKTYANAVYDDMVLKLANRKPVDPMRETQKALGHSSMANTELYLSFKDEELRETLERVGF